MTNRRSLLAIFAAGFAAAFAPASAALLEDDSKRIPAFGIPRGVLVNALGPVPEPQVNASGVLFQRLPLFVTMVSTGRELVPVDSPEGRAVLESMAVNTRSDGTIRHRQHHPTDFPNGRP